MWVTVTQLAMSMSFMDSRWSDDDRLEHAEYHQRCGSERCQSATRRRNHSPFCGIGPRRHHNRRGDEQRTHGNQCGHAPDKAWTMPRCRQVSRATDREKAW